MTDFPMPDPRLEGKVARRKIEPKTGNGPLLVVKPSRNPIKATPYVWRDPATIPPRAWIYGRHYIAKFLSSTVAPAGIGKSLLAIAEAVAIATGRPLLGTQPIKAVRCWIWNGEDPADETERRVAAICLHYGIAPDELNGKLFIDSGRTMPIKIATTMNGAKIAIADDAVEDICETIRANDIGVLIVDPFISCHAVPENDNGAIDAVAKTWAGIADRCNIAVELVHHVRKPAQGQSELTADDARGGSALIAAARCVRVLNRMTTAEAEQAKVEDRRSYFRADTGKANLAPPDKATWCRLIPVELGNGDAVAVVTPWTMPDAMASVTVEHMHRVRATVKEGAYRKDTRSPEWVGNAVADILDLDASDDADAKRIKAILQVWFKTGVLTTERRKDEQRKPKEFVVPGNWNEDTEK